MENKTKTYANNQIVSSAFKHPWAPFDHNHTIRTGALVEDTAACVLLFTDLTTLDWEPMMSPSKSSRCWWLWSPVSLFSLSRATQNWAPISSSSLVLIWRPWRRGRCHSAHQKEKDSEIILKSQRHSHILIKNILQWLLWIVYTESTNLQKTYIIWKQSNTMDFQVQQIFPSEWTAMQTQRRTVHCIMLRYLQDICINISTETSGGANTSQSGFLGLVFGCVRYKRELDGRGKGRDGNTALK